MTPLPSDKVDLKPSPENKPVVELKKPSDQKKKRWPIFILKIGLYLLVFLLILGFTFSYKVILSGEGIFSRQNVGFFDQIKRLVTSGDKQIKGEENDRVNILLVGMGGAGHDGAYLADTIIVASLKPSTKEVALLSIPRDLVVDIPKYGYRKVNNANAFGYLQTPEQGGEWLLQDVLETTLGQPIQYYASVDFDGFRKIVDLVGGLDITVENAFTDYEYPDYSHGYQTISFKVGSQTMNGEKALQYVRSRHGNNGEGSDFARSRRQQNVLSALKKEMLSLGTLTNPKKIMDISDALGTHLKTDMEPWEILRLANLVGDLDTSKIMTRVLDTTAGGLLKTTTGIDGAYLLEPRIGTGKYSEIQDLFENIFQYSELVKEGANIEIQNGTTIAGLGDTIARQLQSLNFNVTKVTNAQDRTYTETQIYDLTLGQKPETLKQLKSVIGGTVNSSAPPFLTNNSNGSFEQDLTNSSLENSLSNMSNTPEPKSDNIDILVILGTDARKPDTPKKSTTNTNANTNRY